MKVPPVFLRGSFRSAMRFALEEADRGREVGDMLVLSRAWKLFLLLPRLLLHRPARGGNVPKSRLCERFADFAAGRWGELLEQSRHCADQAASATRRRRRRREGDNVQRRADRAQALVQMGELSAGRHALEGASIAPGSQATLDALRDARRRPPVPREPLPEELFERRGPLFQLDHDLFAKNIRVARRGAAAGPSGMTADHLRPLLDNVADTTRFWRFAQVLARATVPEDVVDAVKLGKMTALQKPKGGVRGIVSGDIIRRLVARTICQHLSSAVQVATAPFQYALSTKAGRECIAHALQVLTDLNPRTTIVSIDGVSAFDLISRGAMLTGLRSVPGGDSALPFVVQFYGNPSSYLWEDDVGDVHEILQGEGGEQGDPHDAHALLSGPAPSPPVRAVQTQGGRAFARFPGRHLRCHSARTRLRGPPYPPYCTLGAQSYLCE